MKSTVKKFMSRNLITVGADEYLESAYNKMTNHKIRHLPVVDDYDDVIGVISDRDMQRAMLRDKFDNPILRRQGSVFDADARVGSFMSWPIQTVSSSEDLINVCKKMTDEKISALVVTEGDCAVGIITHEDLLRLLSSMLMDQEKSLVGKVQQFAYNSPIGKVADFLSNAGI